MQQQAWLIEVNSSTLQISKYVRSGVQWLTTQLTFENLCWWQEADPKAGGCLSARRCPPQGLGLKLEFSC